MALPAWREFIPCNVKGQSSILQTAHATRLELMAATHFRFVFKSFQELLAVNPQKYSLAVRPQTNRETDSEIYDCSIEILELGGTQIKKTLRYTTDYHGAWLL